MELKITKKILNRTITYVSLFVVMSFIVIYKHHPNITLNDLKRGLPIFITGSLCGSLSVFIRLLLWEDKSRIE